MNSKIAAIVLLILPVCVEHTTAADYKLFVLTGQSNSLGVTNGGEMDPTSGTDPADAHVRFFWDNVADASSSLGTSGGVFTTLQDQQGGFYAGSATHWGPEVEFARSLYRAGVRNFGVIKASRGGGGNTHWSESEKGHMYSHVVDTVTTATDTLTNAGHTFEIIGLLYLQGESDSTAEATIADTRLSDLIINLRFDLPNATNMHAFIGGIAATGTNRNTVRAKQALLASIDTTINYFETLDLQTSLHDSLHYNKAAKESVGERYAQAALEAEVCTPDYGKLVFIGDSITQGGAGQASYRYQVFKHLVDRNSTFTFVGSVTGAYAFEDVSALTPAHNKETFSNVHEGHWGWRAFWENGRTPLPASRRNNNRGEGTILNWTGQASPQEYDLNSAGSSVPYPDPSATGTGNTGTTYTPDTAVIMIGINDIAGGTPPAQVRDDIGLMIDQLRASNPTVRIHLCKVLHTDQNNPGRQANVDALNALLSALADAKNATSPTAPVWIADPSTGFDPASLTHDDVHPNTVGEVYVGDRIAASLGLVEMPPPPSQTSPPPVIEKDSASFPNCYQGNAIFDGSQFINGWTEVSSGATTELLVGDGSDLQRRHINGAGAWLEGTNSGWNTSNDSSWTLEARVKVIAAPNGFAFWLGTDSNLIFLEVFNDRTRANSGSFEVAHTNNDGNFHTFRIAHDSANQNYHVWRNGERLTPIDGVAYDFGNNDSRLIIGDSTGDGFGDLYEIELDSICYDLTGAYIPPGADADNDGIPDSWEYLYFGDLTAADPDEDSDGGGDSNLSEYIADTDPTNRNSRLVLDSLTKTGLDEWTITVSDTSPQRWYRMQTSIDLGLADPWMPVGPPLIGNDTTLEFRHQSAPARTFYRVHASLP